jgi:hypothetical protein
VRELGFFFEISGLAKVSRNLGSYSDISPEIKIKIWAIFFETLVLA